MSLGSKIRQIRCRAGLSQKEVAIKSNITVSFLSQVERDITSPSLKSLTNIARAMGIKVSYLVSEDGTAPKRIELVKKDTNERIVLQEGDDIYIHLTVWYYFFLIM